jgi:hypothetical protein
MMSRASVGRRDEKAADEAAHGGGGSWVNGLGPDGDDGEAFGAS